MDSRQKLPTRPTNNKKKRKRNHIQISTSTQPTTNLKHALSTQQQQQQQQQTQTHNINENTNEILQQNSVFSKARITKVTNTAIADSGADIHITNTETVQKMNLQTYTYDNPITIKFGQGTLQTAYTYTWMGDILEEVAIIPNAPSTLISMYAIATKGLTVSLNTKRITITDEFTGKTIYNRYVDKPGLYYIDLTKFITIRAPKHLDTYRHLSAHARTIQRAIAFDDDENEEQLTATPQNHHTCLLNLSQQEPPLSDITPTQKRKTHTRIPTSTLKRILWLHKSTGHRGREALAQMVETMTNAGEGVTAETVRRVYDHI